MPTPNESKTMHVPRHEFEAFQAGVERSLDRLGARIEELFRARQVNWPLIVSVVGLLSAAVGFGMKNFSDVAALKVESAGLSATNEGLRERTRALEAQLRGVTTEAETQHRWIADVANLQVQALDARARARCTADPSHAVEMPAMSYWPLHGVGQANGSKIE